MKVVEAYIDGGCSPNPGHGASAAILVHRPKGGPVYRKEFSCTGYGSNNHFELTAAILALTALKQRGTEIHLYSDSQYLVKGASEWMKKWKGKGGNWSAALANGKLWKKIDQLSLGHKVYWHWVRGHNGHPFNEEAHELVTKTMKENK